MKLYSSFLTLQQNGSRVYLILRAPTKQALEQAHNSLYNFGATETRNPEYHSEGNVNCVATCLSSWQKISNYFYNLHFFKFSGHNQAYLHALNQIGELKKEANQEVFFKFQDDGKPIVFDGYEWTHYVKEKRGKKYAEFGPFGTMEETENIQDAIVIESFKERKLLPPSKSSDIPSDNNNVFPDKKSINTLMTVVEL